MVDDSDGLRLVRKIANTNERLLADEQAQAILEAMGWVRPVRCKECRYYTNDPFDGHPVCRRLFETDDAWGDDVGAFKRLPVSESSYCSYGEARDD